MNVVNFATCFSEASSPEFIPQNNFNPIRAKFSCSSEIPYREVSLLNLFPYIRLQALL